MTDTTRINCPLCPRIFRNENDLRQHIRYKHGLTQIKLPTVRDDDEPSMAELAIEATIKRDAGLPLTDFEKALVP